jgi:hypothetical protein
MESNETYQAYIEYQKEKTTDPARRSKWLNEEWDQKLTGFRQLFMPYLHLFKPCKDALCLGARTGQEVAALRGSEIRGSILRSHLYERV